MNKIIKNILSGFKNFILKPNIYKIIFLVIALFFTKFLLETNSGMTYKIIGILIIPGFFLFLGIGEIESKSVKQNQLQISNKNENEFIEHTNQQEIVDRVERRTITTNKTETIETIYFLDGHPYRQKQTYYFKRR